MTPNYETDVRRALARQRLLVVGGDPRPHAIDRLKSYLQLEEAIHCPTRKSDASPRRFEAALSAPRLVLVVCARGLCRTQHGKDVFTFCRRLGIPLINSSCIPHPNGLVAAILENRLLDAILRRVREIGGAA